VGATERKAYISLTAMPFAMKNIGIWKEGETK
jgi:hypothetical protein